ncbi:MAG: hypothetical protein ACXWQR_18520 [Ktedonobacterales bacterium]
MRRGGAVRIWCGLVVALLLTVGASWVAAPAHAAANSDASSGDTLSIAVANGTTFTYGAYPSPVFTVVLTLAAKPTANYYRMVSVILDTGQGYASTDNPAVSADQLTYTFTVRSDGGPAAAGGNRTATAKYTDPVTNTTISSNSVSFTVQRATPTVDCMIQNFVTPMSPGQMLQIRIGISVQGSSVQVDPADQKYSIQFVGPTTITTAPMLVDSNSMVTVPAPSQIGFYSQVLCMFGGTNSLTPTSANAAGQPLMISEKHALGGAEFYSNPTTLIAYQPADVYVVFHAGAGLPSPTGYFNIRLGEASAKELALGSDGTLLVHLDQLPTLSGVNQVQIGYQGDPHYDAAVFRFPLTNPPIPAGVSGSGSGGGPQGKATATASATGTPVATMTATTSDGAVPTAAATGSNTVLAWQLGDGGMLWLWEALGMLVLGGGGAAGTVYFVRRSRRAESSVVGVSVLDGEGPGAGIGRNLDGVQRFGSGGGWSDGEW